MTTQLTHSYNTNKVPVANLQASFSQMLLKFINKHADVFEALARNSGPYHGNWLPVRELTTANRSARTPQEQVALIQQQLDEVASQITLLNNQLNAHQTAQPSAQRPPIGIHRFRALKANS